MAKICAICQKGASFGRHIKHKESGSWALKAPRTSRKLQPNLRTLKVMSDGSTGHIKVCMKCYKKLKQL